MKEFNEQKAAFDSNEFLKFFFFVEERPDLHTPLQQTNEQTFTFRFGITLHEFIGAGKMLANHGKQRLKWLRVFQP